MKNLILSLALLGVFAARGVFAETPAPAPAAPIAVSVTVDGEKTDYNLADGRIDEAEAAQLDKLLSGIGGQDALRKALADARADGVITLEESNTLAAMIKPLTKRS